jgi:hypothetical protein
MKDAKAKTSSARDAFSVEGVQIFEERIKKEKAAASGWQAKYRESIDECAAACAGTSIAHARARS